MGKISAYIQSVQRCIQKSFKVKYRTDTDFALASRLVVFLAFVPPEHTETAFAVLSKHVCTSYPEVMHVVNYYEQNYLGLAEPAGTRTVFKCSIVHWNQYAMVLVEGFHSGFKSKVNRPKPSVQEYFRAIRDQQVTTDYHLDRLAHGMTPAMKRKNLNHVLYDICLNFNQYDSVLSYTSKEVVLICIEKLEYMLSV